MLFIEVSPKTEKKKKNLNSLIDWTIFEIGVLVHNCQLSTLNKGGQNRHLTKNKQTKKKNKWSL